MPRRNSKRPESPKPAATRQPTPVSTAKDEAPASGHVDDAAKRPLFPAIPSLSRIVSIAMLVIGIIAVGALFYRVMAGFFVPLFLAVLLVLLSHPIHDWILRRIERPRLAAFGTTAVILMIVLLPLFVISVVAASQFTAMLSRLNLGSLTEALDRGRERFSLSLPYAEQFRSVEEIVGSFDQPADPATFSQSVDAAISLVTFLQDNVDGPEPSEAAAEVAIARLQELAAAVRGDAAETPDAEPVDATAVPRWVPADERFDKKTVRAAAAVRSWMETLLGGPIWSQIRLIANPDQDEIAALINRSRQSLQPRFIQLTGATGGLVIELLIGLVIMVVAVYFFLVDGPAMILTLMRLSPLDDEYERQLLAQFDRTVRAVVLASVLSALAQGVLASFAYAFLGFKSVVLLFLLTSLMGLVPFLGAASVWVPCVIWLAAVDGRWGAAVALLVYGTLVISSVDNLIKAYVLHGRSQIHPLLALLSVMGGVAVFGPVGIIVGPMVVVFLQTLLEILNLELAKAESQEVTVTE